MFIVLNYQPYRKRRRYRTVFKPDTLDKYIRRLKLFFLFLKRCASLRDVILPLSGAVDALGFLITTDVATEINNVVTILRQNENVDDKLLFKAIHRVQCAVWMRRLTISVDPQHDNFNVITSFLLIGSLRWNRRDGSHAWKEPGLITQYGSSLTFAAHVMVAVEVDRDPFKNAGDILTTLGARPVGDDEGPGGQSDVDEDEDSDDNDSDDDEEDGDTVGHDENFGAAFEQNKYASHKYNVCLFTCF